jgi:hypothetical protein
MQMSHRSVSFLHAGARRRSVKQVRQQENRPRKPASEVTEEIDEQHYMFRDSKVTTSSRAREKIPLSIEYQVRVILHLYSGRRRDGDFAYQTEWIGPINECLILVLSLDLAVDPVQGDLTKLEVGEY